MNIKEVVCLIFYRETNNIGDCDYDGDCLVRFQPSKNSHKIFIYRKETRKCCSLGDATCEGMYKEKSDDRIKKDFNITEKDIPDKILFVYRNTLTNGKVLNPKNRTFYLILAHNSPEIRPPVCISSNLKYLGDLNSLTEENKYFNSEEGKLNLGLILTSPCINIQTKYIITSVLEGKTIFSHTFNFDNVRANNLCKKVFSCPETNCIAKDKNCGTCLRIQEDFSYSQCYNKKCDFNYSIVINLNTSKLRNKGIFCLYEKEIEKKIGKEDYNTITYEASIFKKCDSSVYEKYQIPKEKVQGAKRDFILGGEALEKITPESTKDHHLKHIFEHPGIRNCVVLLPCNSDGEATIDSLCIYPCTSEDNTFGSLKIFDKELITIKLDNNFNLNKFNEEEIEPISKNISYVSNNITNASSRLKNINKEKKGKKKTIYNINDFSKKETFIDNSRMIYNYNVNNINEEKSTTSPTTEISHDVLHQNENSTSVYVKTEEEVYSSDKSKKIQSQNCYEDIRPCSLHSPEFQLFDGITSGKYENIAYEEYLKKIQSLRHSYETNNSTDLCYQCVPFPAECNYLITSYIQNYSHHELPQSSSGFIVNQPHNVIFLTFLVKFFNKIFRFW